ncbi:MAG: energy transducer TonB [Pyrinomonadaceae bacterium]
MDKLTKIFVLWCFALICMSGMSLAQKIEGKQVETLSVVRAVAPQYPAIAAATRIEGEVVVEIKISSDGSVFSTKVISGHKRLIDASEKAAKQWKFSALTQGQKEKVLELRFSYSSDYNKNQRSSEFSVIFTPPFKVEIIFIPGTTHSSQKNR